MTSPKNTTMFSFLNNITDHKALPVVLLFLCAVFEILLQPLFVHFSFILRVNSLIALTTLVLAGVLVLLKEVPGIFNRYHADDVELASIEKRSFYITTTLMMGAVALLTLILPLVAWSAYTAMGNMSNVPIIGSVFDANL